MVCIMLASEYMSIMASYRSEYILHHILRTPPFSSTDTCQGRLLQKQPFPTRAFKSLQSTKAARLLPFLPLVCIFSGETLAHLAGEAKGLNWLFCSFFPHSLPFFEEAMKAQESVQLNTVTVQPEITNGPCRGNAHIDLP